MKVVAIGDVHAPFINKPVIKWIIDEIIAKDPTITHVIQMGDLYDFAAYSRFPKRMTMTPRQETELAMDMAAHMWKRIRKAAPQAQCVQLLGNHDERLAKRIVEVMPELDHLIRYQELWAFQGVTTFNDAKNPYVVGDWAFTHGHTKFGKHIEAMHFQYNVCTGHLHKGAQHSYRIQSKMGTKILEELNCGYVADPFSEHLIYRPLNKFFTWTPGVGIIDSLGGRFISYPGSMHES